MEIYTNKRTNQNIIFENEIKKFNDFAFSKEEYVGYGEYVKQSCGACKFGKIRIRIKKDINPSFHWEVKDSQIPICYLDDILSTIKSFFSGENFLDFKGLSFHIIDGEFHEVDSSSSSFEVATVRALMSAINEN